LDLLGYSSQVEAPRGIADAVIPEHQDLFQRLKRDVIASSGKEHVARYKLLTASGESVWIESHLTFIAGLFLVKVNPE